MHDRDGQAIGLTMIALREHVAARRGASSLHAVVPRPDWPLDVLPLPFPSQRAPKAFSTSSTRMIATPIRLSPAIRPLDTGTV